MTQDYDFLFAKSKLPKDTIDLGIGESHLLREAVLNAYDLKHISFNSPNIFEYAPPYGYDPLVEMLESIYGGKIIITTGAKNALSGAFYAMKKDNREGIYYTTPYWSSIPSLISREGLNRSILRSDAGCVLTVAPNNPSGEFDLTTNIEQLPIIHDAAYYTHSYLPKEIELKKFGDIQIFSVAKMYGLSGLRLGIIRVNNEKYYDSLVKFVEATTAGVSTASQNILMKIVELEEGNPSIREDYEEYIHTAITNNRKYVISNLDPDYFAIDNTYQENIGMFAWIKSKIKDFSSAGVNVMPGDCFGDPNFFRMNLSVSLDKIIKAVNKMNKYAKEMNK